MKSKTKIRPKAHLEYYGKVYPSAWKRVDHFRAGRGKDIPFWPDWCFLPLAGSYAIVTAEAERQRIDINNPEHMFIYNDIGVIGALAAWRVTQSIYRFDKDIYNEVINTPISGDIPHEVLFNLPEWCVYVETPGLQYNNQALFGFFAFLEQDANNNRKELRLVLDLTTDFQEKPFLLSIPLHLGQWPLKEAIEKAIKEAAPGAQHILKIDITQYKQEMVPPLSDYLEPLLSLILYLCATNGEIGEEGKKPGNPRPKKTKKGPRLFPAQKVSVWDVGVRMGVALRKARNIEEKGETGEGKQHSSPRPHIRRAHWHGYWKGPRDGDRKYILKWLSPILVGEGDLPTTIRPVKRRD
jgi:hypothetical protein